MLLLFLLALLSSWSITFNDALTAQQTTLTKICNKVQSTEFLATTQIYEPANSCFAYVPAGFLQTLAYSDVQTECNKLKTAVVSLGIGATCMIGQLVDQATMNNLSATVLSGAVQVFLNLQQTPTTYEPACMWYWVAPDGSLVLPDYPIPWCCNEPDNYGVNGVGANQGIFINYDNGGYGILDDQQAYTPSGSFCQCVGPPVASSTTTTMRTTTQYSCAPTTTTPMTTSTTTTITTPLTTTTTTTPTTTSTTTSTTKTTTPLTTTTTKTPTTTSTTISTTTTTPLTTTTTKTPTTTSTTISTTTTTPLTTTTTKTPTTTSTTISTMTTTSLKTTTTTETPITTSTTISTTTLTTPTTTKSTATTPTTTSTTAPTLSTAAGTTSSTITTTTTPIMVTTPAVATTTKSTTMPTTTTPTTTKPTTTTATKKPITTTTTKKPTATTTVPLPPSACSIRGVDPRVHLCSIPRNYKVYPNVADCAAQCAAETNFTCKGFVWMGPNSGCVLHGKIDEPVIMQNGSKWFLVDLDCTAASPCYWPIKASHIDPTSIAAPMKSVNVQNHNQCQALCLLAVLQPLCRAYALSTDPFYTGYNCYLFPPLTASKISAAPSGKFVLYQNQCS